MIWLIAIGCLALGIIIGALASAYLGGTPARIKELESQVKSLEERHDQYKDDVSDHFNVTADLIQQMTQSYKDVYQHLATGAQDLCSAEVANKLLPVGSDAVFETAGSRETALGFTPPKDYAAKESPDQKGALAEDFGIEKSTPAESTGADEPADDDGTGSEKADWEVTDTSDDANDSNEEAAAPDEAGELTEDGTADEDAGRESAATDDDETLPEGNDESTDDDDVGTSEGSEEDESESDSTEHKNPQQSVSNDK